MMFASNTEHRGRDAEAERFDALVVKAKTLAAIPAMPAKPRVEILITGWPIVVRQMMIRVRPADQAHT